jgi:MipA family protein
VMAPLKQQLEAVRDAGDSPITRRLGSQDQFTVGARLSYSFAITPFWR